MHPFTFGNALLLALLAASPLAGAHEAEDAVARRYVVCSKPHHIYATVAKLIYL